MYCRSNLLYIKKNGSIDFFTLTQREYIRDDDSQPAVQKIIILRQQLMMEAVLLGAAQIYIQ